MGTLFAMTRKSQLERARARARWVLDKPSKTPSEELLAEDIVLLLREIERLEEFVTILPAESPRLDGWQ